MEGLLKRGGDGFAHHLRGGFTVGRLNTDQIIHLKYVLFILTINEKDLILKITKFHIP